MIQPIVLLDDDEDDQLLFVAAMSKLAPQRPVKRFQKAEQALTYLATDHPFMIVSELRLPGMDGIEFRQAIEQDTELRKKVIPFIYLTGTVHESLIEQAYELTIQGLFEKKGILEQTLNQFEAILRYWQECIHPKQYSRPAQPLTFNSGISSI